MHTHACNFLHARACNFLHVFFVENYCNTVEITCKKLHVFTCNFLHARACKFFDTILQSKNKVICFLHTTFDQILHFFSRRILLNQCRNNIQLSTKSCMFYHTAFTQTLHFFHTTLQSRIRIRDFGFLFVIFS